MSTASVILNVDPRVTGGFAYLYLDDADALAREGVHLDPDGNLMRFGSPLT